MPQRILSREDLDSFKQQCIHFGKDAARHKINLLGKFKQLQLQDAGIVLQYHDLLLFIKAWPDNSFILQLVDAELTRINAYTKKIYKGNNTILQRRLSGTGIAGSVLTGQFGFNITKWLTERFAADTRFDSAAGETDRLPMLQQIFPRIEYYYTSQEKFSMQQRLKFLLGENTTAGLITTILQYTKDEKMAELIFEQFKVFTEWHLDHPFFNRSFIYGIKLPFFFQEQETVHPVAAKILYKSCPQEIRLNKTQQLHLLDVAKASLAFYFRETDPVSFGEANSTKLFNCGNGIAVALYGMSPARRLSIESYVGYMVFKNNIPVAYGGGWMFGDRCKIGLNIYPPFRKGQSALIFLEVLRLYRCYYKQQRFIIKPYQYGYENKEGLQSGAFWFYYKLGFRPVERSIAEIAETEHQSGKRSSLHTLKIFTRCNMELKEDPLLPGDLEPETLSKAVSSMILGKYKGNRKKAIRVCKANLLNQLSPLQNNNIQLHKKQAGELCLLFGLIPGIGSWSWKEKEKLAQLIHSKITDERTWIFQLQQHKKLMRALYAVAKAASNKA